VAGFSVTKGVRMSFAYMKGWQRIGAAADDLGIHSSWLIDRVEAGMIPSIQPSGVLECLGKVD
jgi:hypothetical protein